MSPFKTSLIGYKKKAVIQQLEVNKNACMEQLAEKQRMLNTLMLENQDLINTKNELLAGNLLKDELTTKIENVLYQGFIENFQRLYEFDTKMDAVVATNEMNVIAQREKRDEIRNKIRDFTLQMEAEIKGGE